MRDAACPVSTSVCAGGPLSRAGCATLALPRSHRPRVLNAGRGFCAQDPVLFAGSVRANLDPFGDFPDRKVPCPRSAAAQPRRTRLGAAPTRPAGASDTPPPPPPPSYEVDTPRPSPRTNRTRCVPHPVLIGHAASLTPYGVVSRHACSAPARAGLTRRAAARQVWEALGKVRLDGYLQAHGGLEQVVAPRETCPVSTG